MTLKNCVIKGYHTYKVKPPMTDSSISLLVDREYTNLHDCMACLVWTRPLEDYLRTIHDMMTHDKRQLKLRDIVNLPIGHTLRGLGDCFTTIMDDGGRISCVPTGEPTPSFSPWPAPQEKGGGM